MTCGFAAALLVALATDAFAHRLDEYLQGTIISLEKNRVALQMTLTPGVAVFPLLISQMDTNADGAISDEERRAYAHRVLHDIKLSFDKERLTPHLVSMRFPDTGEMKEGRGEIQLDLSAELPSGGRNRKLIFENRHESRIAAYQVNCLVPRDPDIRITAQQRNYSQSLYRLEYARTDLGFGLTWLAIWFSGFGWLGLTALFLLRQARSGKHASGPKETFTKP